MGSLNSPRKLLFDHTAFQRSSFLTPKAIVYHIYSLWLFTASDLKTIVAPSLVFGVVNALAASQYEIESYPEALKETVPRRLCLTLCWIWLNLLPFTINNQKSPDSIREDAANKPWRTLPSERMTPQQARNLMLILYPVAVALSAYIGGLRQSVGLVILGVWYNNFAGGDASCLVRNLINAYGYVCFASGAMEVSLGLSLPMKPRLVGWFGMIAAIIFTTVHLQDMYDQEGDNARGRKTVPLVLGDSWGRWTAAIPLLFWGIACPYYWRTSVVAIMLCATMAGLVAARSLLFRSVESDVLTFKLWNIWVALIFSLPHWMESY